MFTHAITRLPGDNFADGLTTSTLGRPSFPLILQQHLAYRQVLQHLGLEVLLLPAEPNFPDAYFVEDPAVVTQELAIITIPGALSRQGEQDSLEPILNQFLPVARINPPATLDGGDVLCVGKHFFIGLSERTNQDGASQLSELLQAIGYTSVVVPISAGLHLKSSVNYVGKDTLLITESLAAHPAFSEYEKILLDPEEEYAANTLLVNHTLLMPMGFPKTHTKLAQLGLPINELDVSEVQKMDGGLTCMSLRF